MIYKETFQRQPLLRMVKKESKVNLKPTHMDLTSSYKHNRLKHFSIV